MPGFLIFVRCPKTSRCNAYETFEGFGQVALVHETHAHSHLRRFHALIQELCRPGGTALQEISSGADTHVQRKLSLKMETAQAGNINEIFQTYIGIEMGVQIVPDPNQSTPIRPHV